VLLRVSTRQRFPTKARPVRIEAQRSYTTGLLLLSLVGSGYRICRGTGRPPFRPHPEEHPCKSIDLHGCVSKGGGGQPTSGLPEIGTLSAQVGNSRLAIRAVAPCFETHRSAIEIVASFVRVSRCDAPQHEAERRPRRMAPLCVNFTGTRFSVAVQKSASSLQRVRHKRVHARLRRAMRTSKPKPH
jgi:hypothetical protein